MHRLKLLAKFFTIITISGFGLHYSLDMAEPQRTVVTTLIFWASAAGLGIAVADYERA
jgi:hypothetical protein